MYITYINYDHSMGNLEHKKGDLFASIFQIWYAPQGI